MPQPTHWTQKLFVENAHLYLPFLQKAQDRAPREVDALCGLFEGCGVPEGGRVLDVACGIGRHSVLLAKLGYEVVGIDISPLFIDEARKSARDESATARFVVGNGWDIDSVLAGEPPFDACINMFTSHSYYGREGDVAMFGMLARLAVAGAVLVVATVNRDFLVRHFEPEGVQTAGEYAIQEQRTIDLETSSMRNSWDFREGETVAEATAPLLSLDIEHRVYSLHEMKMVLEESGWLYRGGYGNPGHAAGIAPLDLDTYDMWVVAQKPG